MGGIEQHLGPNGSATDDRRHIAGWPRDRWRADTSDHEARLRIRRNATASSHAKLPETERATQRDENERLRSDRVVGHTVVGVVATAVFLVVLALFEGPGSFAFAMIAFFVALGSFTSAIGARLGEAWGWNLGTGAPPALRFSDRAVLAGTAWLRRRSWFRRRSTAVADASSAGAIRDLPPESPE